MMIDTGFRLTHGGSIYALVRDEGRAGSANMVYVPEEFRRYKDLEFIREDQWCRYPILMELALDFETDE